MTRRKYPKNVRAAIRRGWNVIEVKSDGITTSYFQLLQWVENNKTGVYRSRSGPKSITVAFEYDIDATLFALHWS